MNSSAVRNERMKQSLTPRQKARRLAGLGVLILFSSQLALVLWSVVVARIIKTPPPGPGSLVFEGMRVSMLVGLAVALFGIVRWSRARQDERRKLRTME